MPIASWPLRPPVTIGHSRALLGVERSWDQPACALTSQLQSTQGPPTSPLGTTHSNVLLKPMFHQMQLCCWRKVVTAGMDISLQSWNTLLGTGHGSFPHVYPSALGLWNVPVSSITVLVKCTAGTFWLNFLTGHYGFSERKSYLWMTNYIPHKPSALLYCKLPIAALPRYETVTKEEKIFLMAVGSDDSYPFSPWYFLNSIMFSWKLIRRYELASFL